eukprot:3600662-Rhodomonas_salina.1
MRGSDEGDHDVLAGGEGGHAAAEQGACELPAGAAGPADRSEAPLGRERRAQEGQAVWLRPAHCLRLWLGRLGRLVELVRDCRVSGSLTLFVSTIGVFLCPPPSLVPPSPSLKQGQGSEDQGAQEGAGWQGEDVAGTPFLCSAFALRFLELTSVVPPPEHH